MLNSYSYIHSKISLILHNVKNSLDSNQHFQALKELYTSISTLAQKLVLTLLNNEFILKILNSIPFGRKIRKHFRSKTPKKYFFCLNEWFEGFIANIQSFIFFNCSHFFTYTPKLQEHNYGTQVLNYWPKIFAKKINKCLRSGPSVLMYNYKNV